jgi:c-di-GMP-binding flagellar brake protein YcgR
MTIESSTVIKINQLVDIYLTHNLRGKHYRSRVEEVHSHHLVLAMPFDKGFPVYASVGAPIYGKVITDSAPYLFVSHYMEKRMSPLPVWIISPPTEITKLQQREYVRIDAKIPATVTLIDQEEDVPPANLIVNDISGGGARLVSPQSYPLGTSLLITFELPGQEIIETIGQVVRSEQPQTDLSVYWIGVKYVGLQERQRNKIIKYVFQKQLERHRRGF